MVKCLSTVDKLPPLNLQTILGAPLLGQLDIFQVLESEPGVLQFRKIIKRILEVSEWFALVEGITQYSRFFAPAKFVDKILHELERLVRGYCINYDISRIGLQIFRQVVFAAIEIEQNVARLRVQIPSPALALNIRA